MVAVSRIVLFVAAVAAVPLSLWATYRALAFGYERLGHKEPLIQPRSPPPLSPPNLGARAGDGDVRLTWSIPSGQLPLVEQWEFEQSNSGTVAGTYSTGSNATSYLVADLTNGVTYSFRVRAVLRAGTFGTWSAAVSATPMQVGDVLDRMERHQQGMERHQWSMARQHEEMVRQQERMARHQEAMVEHQGTMAEHQGTMAERQGTMAGHQGTMAEHQGTMAQHQGTMAQHQGTMAQAQGRIADSVSAVGASIAENGKAFRQLADRGVDALEKLATPSESGNCPDCPDNNVPTSTHNIHHTTFAFRFAPPWFNADQRSLFTSYVVFPEEAKFEDWISGGSEVCGGDEPPASVCPETTFYKKTMWPFLEELSRCATTERVQLRTVGFASSTRLNESLGGRADELEGYYENHIDAVAELCDDKRVGNETNHSKMFNLIIANERAANAVAMLEEIVSAKEDAFVIEAIPWCSYKAMALERQFDDGGDPIKGLMNRRVEVRLAAVPSC